MTGILAMGDIQRCNDVTDFMTTSLLPKQCCMLAGDPFTL